MRFDYQGAEPTVVAGLTAPVEPGQSIDLVPGDAFPEYPSVLDILIHSSSFLPADAAAIAAAEAVIAAELTHPDAEPSEDELASHLERIGQSQPPVPSNDVAGQSSGASASSGFAAAGDALPEGTEQE